MCRPWCLGNCVHCGMTESSYPVYYLTHFISAEGTLKCTLSNFQVHSILLLNEKYCHDDCIVGLLMVFLWSKWHFVSFDDDMSSAFKICSFTGYIWRNISACTWHHAGAGRNGKHKKGSILGGKTGVSQRRTHMYTHNYGKCQKKGACGTRRLHTKGVGWQLRSKESWVPSARGLWEKSFPKMEGICQHPPGCVPAEANRRWAQWCQPCTVFRLCYS